MNELRILREAGFQHVIANFTRSTVSVPKLYTADRRGRITTLLRTVGNPLAGLSGIEVDPRTGDLITTDFMGPSSLTKEPGGVEVNRVSIAGKVTTLATFGSNACKVTRRDTVWIGGFVPASPSNIVSVMNFDLSTNTVLTIVRFPGVAPWAISSVEVYGSHPLTANGTGGPGRTIRIDIASQRPAAGGALYQIALSTARRPGVKLVTGEWLHLNVTDPLFLLTAQNLAPQIFRRFSGTTTPFGTASAEVKLPAGFPSGLGLTIFCAAVIINSGTLVEVTNTHWFEL